MTQESIAIVGMSCLFPKSPDLETYWGNIVRAVDCISDVPADHSWKVDEHWDPKVGTRDKTYSRRGGFLDKVPFDPMQWGITPNALDATDTSQLLSLIVARECLKDAGIDPDADDWNRDRTGVILGVTGTQEMAVTLGARLHGPTWRKAMLRCGIDGALADAVVDDISNHFPEWQEQSFPGLLGNVVAGRIANRLDLGGTNCVVDAACASSLAAVQLALADLQSGRADLVLSGGADTINDIFMYQCFTATPALSKGDDARPFDENGDGILISEGISMLALKRLSDAQRDGDRIYAVIKGIGSSSDGRSKSIYAPSSSGQVKCVERAHQIAGIGPETIELIEAHGTGTKAGDLAELEGLKEVFGKSSKPGRWVNVGTVKSQIGHTKSTAGAAGLMKAALALHQRILPPTIKITTPNPKMDLSRSPLYLSPRARPWVRAADHPRRAGVSAFGFGGSNFHCIVEEHGGDTAPRFTAEAELVLLAAPDAASLIARLDAVDTDAPTLQHAVRPLLERFAADAHVVGFLASSLDELKARLATARTLVQAGPGERDGVSYGVPQRHKLAIVFPGQGSQYVEMGRTLALRHPVVRAALDAADTAFVHTGRPALSTLTFPPPAWDTATDKAQAAALTETQWAQPAIGALSKGMYDLLRRFGVTPDAVAGHSYGELVALYAAGVLSEDDLWTASRVRGESMAEKGIDRGTMAAVSGDLAAIEAVLPKSVVVANRNHPQQAVISGSRSAIALALKALEAAGLSAKQLPVSAAFHSTLVADAAEPFAEILAELSLGEPTVPVYSTATAKPYPAGGDTARELLVRQITAPVDWVGIVEALYADGVRTFVECGPSGVLSGLVFNTLKGREGVAVLSLDRRRDKVDGDVQLKDTLVQLAVRGVPVSLQPLLEEPLPATPRTAGSKATVFLAGANYRKPETLNPPAPKLPVKTAPRPPVQSAPVQAAPAAARATPAPQPAATASTPAAPMPSLSSGVTPVATNDNSSPVDASALVALLETTRSSLAAFQQAQERTARVHERFLDAHAQANASFQQLFQTHARLIELASGASVADLPRLTAPAPSAPIAAPVAPTPPLPAGSTPSVERVLNSFLNPGTSDQQRVGTFQAPRPKVAHADDLPPLMKADSLGGGMTPIAAPAPVAAAVAPRAPSGPSRDTLVSATLAAVADKTGYPADMLELSMDMESDLGIDSIKRVEILAAVQDQVPGLPELDNDALASLRTLGDVVSHLEGLLPRLEGVLPKLGSAPAAALTPAAGPSRDTLVKATLAAVADKTGYPADMLELSMDMESDLGIDSIKRVEILAAVQDQVPGLPELDNDALASLRTLGDVVSHLEGLLPRVEGLLPRAGAAPAPKSLASAGPSRDTLVSATLASVADKTGYPADMLELSMDMESDLGIDSIKRVEILAAVQDQVPGLPELDNDALSALRTLGDVVDHLEGLLPQGAPSASAPVAAPAVQVTCEPVAYRHVVVVPAPAGRGISLGRTVVVGKDNQRNRAIAKALTDRGIDAPLVGLDAVPTNGSSPDTVIYLGSLDGQPPHAAFQVARSLEAGIRFATVTAQGGAFGHDGAPAQPYAGAVAGLVKTLAQEWEGTRCLALDIAEDTAPARIAEELTLDRGVVEVGLGERGAITLAVQDLPASPAQLTPVQPGDLVVVSGGARGVTAAVVLELARRWQPALMLIGRSPLVDEPAWALGVADAKLKAARLQAAKAHSEKLSPRDLDADVNGVLAGREVRATLASVKAAGSQVAYRSADVRDAQAVGDIIAHAVQHHGPVRGIVHGAGVIADKRVEDKTDAQFDRVWGTKVEGWQSLAAHAPVADLRFVAMFASVAGRYGNIGQLDYAMANEALTRFAMGLRAQGVLARSFAWGPWEAGMVTPELKKQLQGRGMSLIPLKEGAALFCDDLARGGDTVEVVVGGPEQGGALLASTTGGRVAHTLEGQADTFLRDHRIDGKPVLPAVMVLEWMARAARSAHPDLHLAGVRDFAVLKGVVVDDTTRVDLHWTEVPARHSGGRTLSFELRGNGGALGTVTHYRGVVDLSREARATTPFGGSNGLGGGTYPYSIEEAYDRFLFHGPKLQGITAVSGFSDHGMVARLRTSAPSDLDVHGESWETDPVTLDSLLQLMVLWVRETTGSAALPSAIGEYHQHGPLRGTLTCHLEMAPQSASAGRFSATLVDDKGAVVATLTGGGYTASPHLNQAFARASA